MEPWFSPAVAFSAQVAIVVGAAGLAEQLCRPGDPRLRLRFWRGVALACLALPLTGLVTPPSVTSGITLLAVGEATASTGVLSVNRAFVDAAWWLLGAGALVRLAWLGAGTARLRQLRRRSRPAAVSAALETLRVEVAPRAEFRMSADVAQPAVFGLRHPVILLPECFFDMESQAQRTVACHELLHVARRDWPWIVVEELARAVLWFHPAVWWLVEQIQESREQLVDRLVIARIPSKQAYMRALLAFADSAPLPAAATAFLRQRHLRSRLRTLGKEPVMSRTRSMGIAVTLVCVMGAAVGGTAVALPLGWPGAAVAATGQDVVEGKDPGVTMPTVISEVKPQYTPEAMRARIEGTVLMTTVVRTDGRPADIQVTRSLDAEHGLDKQAVDALAQWRFQPGRKDGEPVAVRVTVEMTFTLKK